MGVPVDERPERTKRKAQSKPEVQCTSEQQAGKRQRRSSSAEPTRAQPQRDSIAKKRSKSPLDAKDPSEKHNSDSSTSDTATSDTPLYSQHSNDAQDQASSSLPKSPPRLASMMREMSTDLTSASNSTRDTSTAEHEPAAELGAAAKSPLANEVGRLVNLVSLLRRRYPICFPDVCYRWHWLRIVTASSISDLSAYQVILSLSDSELYTLSRDRSASTVMPLDLGMSPTVANDHPSTKDPGNDAMDFPSLSVKPIGESGNDQTNVSSPVVSAPPVVPDVPFSETVLMLTDALLAAPVVGRVLSDLHFLFYSLSRGAARQTFLHVHSQASVAAETLEHSLCRSGSTPTYSLKNTPRSGESSPLHLADFPSGLDLIDPVTLSLYSATVRSKGVTSNGDGQKNARFAPLEPARGRTPPALQLGRSPSGGEQAFSAPEVNSTVAVGRPAGNGASEHISSNNASPQMEPSSDSTEQPLYCDESINLIQRAVDMGIWSLEPVPHLPTTVPVSALVQALISKNSKANQRVRVLNKKPKQGVSQTESSDGDNAKNISKSKKPKPKQPPAKSEISKAIIVKVEPKLKGKAAADKGKRVLEKTKSEELAVSKTHSRTTRKRAATEAPSSPPQQADCPRDNVPDSHDEHPDISFSESLNIAARVPTLRSHLRREGIPAEEYFGLGNEEKRKSDGKRSSPCGDKEKTKNEGLEGVVEAESIKNDLQKQSSQIANQLPEPTQSDPQLIQPDSTNSELAKHPTNEPSVVSGLDPTGIESLAVLN